MEIIPAVLTHDIVAAQVLITDILNKRKVARMQVDFIDGEFANNKTFRPSELDLFQYMPVKFDAHLMVVEDNVLVWSKVAQKVGYDRIITQVESISHPEEYTGLALDIHSPITAIRPEWYKKLDVVLLMAVEPGFGSQEFIPGVLDKVSYLRNLRDLSHLTFKIQVDGGVHKKHLWELEKAGVDEVVVGGKRFIDEFII